jgi:hypothetical protein
MLEISPINLNKVKIIVGDDEDVMFEISTMSFK